MNELLTDKTAVVTGAASGNGRAIAYEFAKQGADIVVADVRSDPREGGRETTKLIREETDSSAKFVQCDVTSTQDLSDTVAAADEFGGIDVMANNAGITLPESFPQTDEETYGKIMDVNVKGVHFGAQEAARRMIERDVDGSIINISSDAGIRATSDKPAYAASKGAVRLLTYALAANLGDHGIRVNAIHPGVTETAFTTQDTEFIGSDREQTVIDQIPSGRVGQPEDIGKAAVFLASDLSDYVNGESLLVDGGRLNAV